MKRSAARLKRLQKKLPTWFSAGITLPQKAVCVEQASSEATSWYRSSVILKPTDGFFADVTGGLGVDAYYMAKGGKRKGIYIEKDSATFLTAKNNFKEFNLDNVMMYNAESMDFLNNDFSRWYSGDDAKRLDVIFADPCRRSIVGGERAFKLQDYEPNVLENLPMMLRVGRRVIVKSSPFLDISLACNELRMAVSFPLSIDVHVVSVDGSCKEVVYNIQPCSNQQKQQLRVQCVEIHGGRFCAALQSLPISFSSVVESNYLLDLHREGSLPCPSFVENDLAEGYVYEPSASIMKAGGFKSIAQDYHLCKLHLSSHLYWHRDLLTDFPGRSFRVLGECRPERTKLRRLLANVAPAWSLQKGSQVLKAHVTVRNYPTDVAEIRKKCGILEAGSGDAYIFATTRPCGKKRNKRVLLLCEKQ